MYTAKEIMYDSAPKRSLINTVLQITELDGYLILSKFTITSSMPDAHMCALHDEGEQSD